MLPRGVRLFIGVCGLCCAACGGGPRASSADLVAIRQPTPDPTLDAVVRDLPRALAGVVMPTPTPTPPPVIVVPVPKVTKPPPPTPTLTATLRAVPKPPTPTPTAKPRP